MTGPEFKAALRRLRLTQRRFAAFVGYQPNTTHRWVTGELPVPKWAVLLLAAWEITGVPDKETTE